MMVSGASFIVLMSALHIITVSYCSPENVYCVIPTATSCSSCPYNTHCAALSEYAQDAELYFASNIIMVFLSGDHVLDRNITVTDVARLTMCGESSSNSIATIVRNGSVGFSFTNMVDFNIYSLAFATYNMSSSYGSCPASNSVLFLKLTPSASLVNCSFHDNLGTALTVHNTSITLIENKFIHNQCGCESLTDMCKLGCGITAFNSTLMFTGNTTFLSNKHNNLGASEAGAGAVLAVASSLHFTGTNNFCDNFHNSSDEVGVGGAIHLTNNTVLTFHGTNNFINNSARNDGGAIFASHSAVLTFTGTNNFIDNHVNNGDGGAIRTSPDAVLSFNGTNKFTGNLAKFGGAIDAESNVLVTFIGASVFSNNSAGLSGGAISIATNVVLTFDGTYKFISNSAKYRGGAIFAIENILLMFTGTNVFSNNIANAVGGAIYAAIDISSSFTGTSNFSSNFAMRGGAILAYFNSTLTFDGDISFINNGHNANSGLIRGGAMYLSIRSTFAILPHTTVCWENNQATLGGAIYVADVNPFIYCTPITPYIPREKCFFQLHNQNLSNGLDIKLTFKNNSADDAGSVLYGGAIDNCKLTDLDSYSSGDVFNMLFHNNDTDYNTTSKISSYPFRTCLCKNNLPDCYSNESQYLQVYPGETFQISVVAVGQRNGTVSSNILSIVRTYNTDSHPSNLLDYQYLQQTSNACTTLNYTVFSLSQKVNLELFPEGSLCSKFDGGSLNISVNLNPNCPPGFNISELEKSCVCDPRLAQYTNQCNITNGVGQITRDSNQHFWVGYDNSSHELILHPYCPFDYCVNDAKVFALNNTDTQCSYKRSGLLCGRCKEGYSLLLGTHQCRKCTNSHLALLIPFALMGVVLVFFLLVCKLTVATGTLSGLVFYANIVGDNRTIFLPVKSTDAFSVFIAWLNLDFGIETCFFDGMDAYSKTWLQFVFPVYIWVLVGLMILFSHYSRRFANLLGSNPVSVLATLILLSYAKFLRTLIAATSFATLDYPRHFIKSVWLYDANVDYITSKHMSLFLVAILVFLFLFLPYTLLLVFGQWLQGISHLKLFSWVNSARLKPFMDSYHAPYKPRHRYWPGLLLIIRLVLLLAFGFNRQQDPSNNLLAILVGTGILQMWAWVSGGGVYKNWCLDALEGSFVLNLIILVGATYHVNHSGGNQLAVGYTSVSIALVTFIAILAYHIFQQLKHTKLWKKMPELDLKFKTLNTKQRVDNLSNQINDPTESMNLDQLREPWLEDLLQSSSSF